MAKRILVYADWQGLNGEQFVGTLMTELTRGKEIFSFEYAKEWIQSPMAQILDPDLALLPGPQFLKDDKPNFGMFLDSSPDRWGRVLMKRRESILARAENRKALVLQESDFLLGVFDGTRMGGLRFKLDEDGSFLNHQQEIATPPWTSLRELENASLKLENDSIKASEEIRWLNMLMAPGSSLGGARPKASVMDPSGKLFIAKFPSTNDDRDMGGWEFLVHELARKSGIDVAPAMIRKFSSKHHTFLTQRFDRNNSGTRIHFASAMTLLGLKDGTDHFDGRSYFDLVEIIQQSGERIEVNLKALWKRMLFNILIKNTDDHLRNHGFLLGNNGWELSPAYDMNANPDGLGLTLNISEDDNSLDPELALMVAPHFRVKQAEASETFLHMKKVISQWPQIAATNKLARREQELMESSFLR